MPLRIKRVDPGQGFRLDMTGLFLNRILVGYNTFGADTLVDTGTIQDKIIVSAGHDARRTSLFDIDDVRVASGAHEGIAMSPSRRVRINRRQGAGMYGAILPADLLTDRFRETTGREFSGPIQLDPRIDLRKGPGRVFREALFGLLQEIETQDPANMSATRNALLEDLFISVVLSLPGSHLPALTAQEAGGAAPGVVRRAEEYMDAHFQNAITLSDLVRVAGCSRSALTKAFRASRGYSAMQFLSDRRLDFARRRLQEDPSATATEVALASGFSNQGRFAKAYRARFGELPSETRARHYEAWRFRLRQ